MTQLLTEAEAAELLRIGARTLRALRRDRKIRYVALTALKIAYRLEDCEEYIASCVRLDSGERSDQREKQGKGRGGRSRPAASMRQGNIVPFSQRKASA